MFEIKGNTTTAVCYATVIEEVAIRQIQRMCDYEFTKDAKIRIMPDAHAGIGCTIGTTMTVTDSVVPNMVGVDIGCGIYAVELGKIDIDFQRIDEACHFVPSGKNVWDTPIGHFDFTVLRCYKALEQLDRLACCLGTLGGGNHFIEIDVASDGTNYLMIHSGSRNLGTQVAKYYQTIAIDLNSGKLDFPIKKGELIRTYKEQGRDNEIQEALKALEKEFSQKEPAFPKDLCPLYGTWFDDYIHDMKLCQAFALQNRETIARRILEATGLSSLSAFHVIHNYVDERDMVLRKGAVSAHKDETVLISVNMRDGNILARGKGNSEWNASAPHGSGRLLSRTAAKETLDMETYQKAMEGIYSTTVNESTLDEAPMAYKALSDIIGTIEETVEIIDILKPVYNFKASE